jgi:peptidyl-prolyl cis-trans isomerase SurA
MMWASRCVLAWVLVPGWALAAPAGVVVLQEERPGFREVERVAAVVNDELVLLSEVEEQLVPLLNQVPASLKGPARQKRVEEMRREVLEGLIAERLLQQQVEALHLDVTSEEIERAIAEVREQNQMDDEQLTRALRQQGLSVPEYREALSKQLLKAKVINLKVRARVNLTEADIQSTVARRFRLQAPEYKVRAKHALFAVMAGSAPEVEAHKRAGAEELLRRARAGEDFEGLARELSDPPTRDNGGDLGFFKRGELMPEFEAVAWKTEPGRLAGPVRTTHGWHVIYVVDRRTLDTRTPEQVKRDLREALVAEEMERAYKRYISELRAESHVEVRM